MLRRLLHLIGVRRPRKDERFFETLNETEFDGVDEYGRTPLHYAALGGLVDHLASLLHARGEDIDLPDRAGWTPLHFAASASSAACVGLLLERGAHVDPKDEHGNTPLGRAVFASKGEGDVIALFRAAGADPCTPNNHGVSPLQLARTIANYPIAQHFADLPE